jgi:hypothetical protein
LEYSSPLHLPHFRKIVRWETTTAGFRISAHTLILVAPLAFWSEPQPVRKLPALNSLKTPLLCEIVLSDTHSDSPSTLHRLSGRLLLR